MIGVLITILVAFRSPLEKYWRNWAILTAVSIIYTLSFFALGGILAAQTETVDPQAIGIEVACLVTRNTFVTLVIFGAIRLFKRNPRPSAGPTNITTETSCPCNETTILKRATAFTAAQSE